MAKTKKASNESKVATDGSESKISKKLTKDAKPHVKHPTIAEMVVTAMEKMNSRKGSTLAAIRLFIAKNNNLKMTKQRQNLIKKFLESEFNDGGLVMTNHDGETIVFTKRFKLVSGTPTELKTRIE